MTIKKSINSIAVCGILVFAASTARADIGSYTANVFNMPNNLISVVVSATPVGGTSTGPTVNGLENSSPINGSGNFNFQSSGVQPLSTFLSPILATCTTLITSANCTAQMSNPGPGTLYSTEMVLSGSATFSAGETITIQHDDGVVLSLQGLGNVINSPSPTSLRSDSYLVTSAFSGTFNVYYVATNGNPEDLILTTSGGTVPEPTSILLFGTVFLGMSGLLRKKLAKR